MQKHKNDIKKSSLLSFGLLKNLTIQLILVILGSLLFGRYLPVAYKSFFLAVSLSLKEGLIFCLPIIIFVCLFSSMISNQGRALRFVIYLLVTVCLSNFISIMASYGIGKIGLSFVSLAADENVGNLAVLDPLWKLKLPVLVENINVKALILGLVLGLLFSFLPYQKPVEFARKANHYVTLFLRKLFIPLLPIFALGFILKMDHEGILQRVIQSYGPIIVLMVLGIFSYILLMFGIAANFKPSVWLGYIKNILPVGILGFSTMSSLATMPVTITAAEKNTKQPELARAIIPATVNIHMIGDSIAIPILAMAVMLTFGHSLPTFMQYLMFAQVFMIAKFAVPGVPCGTIWILLPIFEQHFGFTTEMSAFIGAIFILFDSFITVGNVLGNSAFVIILTKLLQWAPTKRKVIEVSSN